MPSFRKVIAMLLTTHITLEEMTITQVRGVDNTPTDDIIEHLRTTATVLERVRTLLGNYPLLINSGYRSPAVNMAVGGFVHSAHLFGYAADFICPSFGTPLEICRKIADTNFIRFDQLIEEGTWVHISFDPRMRGEVMTKRAIGGYDIGLVAH